MSLLKAAQLRQERARLRERANELIDAAGQRDGGLTDEDRQELDRIHDTQESLLRDAERLERVEQLNADAALSDQPRGVGAEDRAGGDPPGNGNRDPEGPVHKSAAYARAFWQFVRHGARELSTEQRSMLQEGHAQLTHEQRALASSVDTAGGYLVPQGFSVEVEKAMKQFGGMRLSRARILPTDSGNPLPIPAVNDTNNSGRRIGENKPVQGKDVTFQQHMLNAYFYTSDAVLVPLALLQDEAVNLEGELLPDLLGERLGRVTNSDFTVGDGASGPEGVVTAAQVGRTGPTGQTASITATDLTELLHSVDPAYRSNAEWMFHDQTLKALKLLKDGEGRPLWKSGIAVREPDTIDGHPYVINQDMPEMAANAKSVLFGDFRRYWIRDVRPMQLVVLRERYMDNLQVGFFGFSRHDAKLVDAGAGAIKAYRNSGS